jgi:hypothetical protein
MRVRSRSIEASTRAGTEGFRSTSAMLMPPSMLASRVVADVVDEKLESALLDPEPEGSRKGAAAVLVHRVVDQQLGEKL